MEDKISATPLAEQTGALPALHRGMQVLTGMPSAVYHAVIDDPHDADEEARANATSAALGGNVPSRVAMVYNRLFIDPQIQAGQKADLFQNLSDQARAAGNHETADRLQHAANVHREGSYAPMLGPWVADIVDRRFGLSSGTPDPYAYLEIAPAMAVPEATKELGGAALKTEAGQAAVRGAAKTADYVIQKGIPVATAAAGGKLGLLAGQALGLPGELGPTGLALYGTKQGFEFGQRLVSRIPEVPGTKFGLPPEPPAIDWSAFERTEPPSGPLPPPPPPGGGGGGPPPATPERLAAIRQEFEDIRARGQGAPATEAPAEAPAAAPTGDELAREYGYKNEQEAIDDVGRGPWQIAKAQGRAAGRPVGAPPPVAEPPAPAQPAAAPAPEPTAEPARDPQVVQAIHDAADRLDDAGMLQTLRAQQEYERQVAELEEGRERYAAEHGEHGTKQMLAAAAGEAPPEQWTKLPNWTAADEQRINALLASHDIKVSEGELQPVTQRGQALLDQMQRENAQTAANRAAAAARVAQPYGTPQFSPESEGYGADNKFITQQRYEATKAALDAKIAKINAEGMRAGPPSPMQLADLMPHYMEIGAYHLEAGLKNFADWSAQMLKEGGEQVRPYLEDIWDKVTRGPDQAKVQATRKPTGKNATETSAQPLLTNREVYERNDPSVLQDNADLITGKNLPREPQRNDVYRGQPRFIDDAEFNKAHKKWEGQNDPYVGFKPTSDDPAEIADQFIEHLTDNKRAIWNMIPEHLRELWMQWYETARRGGIQLAAKTGITNEQGSGLIATQSPQKGWPENQSLADRMNTVWHEQQDTVTSQKMLATGRSIADSKTIQQVMKSKILEGKTLAQLDSPEVLNRVGKSKLPELQSMAKAEDGGAAQLQGVWVRLYDQAHNSPWYRISTATGEDLGFARNDDGSLTPVRWQSTRDVGKGISILKDGSLENILANLGDSHKVPNFYNNNIAPDHPLGFYTSDTHDVAAGMGQPLGSSAPEVSHNFGGTGTRTHADTGLKGTYGLHAESGMKLADELEILPRQVQSVVWEGIRKIFPDNFKTARNLATIKDIWRQYEAGDLTHEQVWNKIFKARAEAGFDEATGGVPKEFTESRAEYESRREVERTGLRSSESSGLDELQPVGNDQGVGPANRRGAVSGAGSSGTAVAESQQGKVAPLRKARRTSLVAQ